MSDASTLSDQETGRRIAEALWHGVTYVAHGEKEPHVFWHNPDAALPSCRPAPSGSCWHHERPSFTSDQGIPPFASSIAAVKQAEEKLHAAGYSMVIRHYPDGWVVRWVGFSGAVADALTEARARAEACLAALLALAASTPAEPEEK